MLCLANQASPIDIPLQSHTLDPALKASGARRKDAIRLLIKVERMKGSIVTVHSHKLPPSWWPLRKKLDSSFSLSGKQKELDCSSTIYHALKDLYDDQCSCFNLDCFSLFSLFPD